MREDLEDAYGAIDWARTHLPPLQHAFQAWFDSPPYLVVEEPHPEMRQKLFKLEINRRLPPSLNAGVGAVINSVRSSLDLLAASLARRNGIMATADHHFPIYSSHQDFMEPLNEAKRKKWLSPRNLAIIEGLKPYAGGDDVLYAIHRLDVTRKHERLVRVNLTPRGAVVSPGALEQGFRMPAVWPRFQDGAVIGWTDINATDCEFHISAEITFDKTELLSGAPILPTLYEFVGLADGIVQRFERT